MRCSASPMSSTRARRSSGVSAPVTASIRSFGKALRRPSRDMIGGGDEAAEDDRVGAFGDERLQDLDRRVELRIGRPASGPRPAPPGSRAVPLRPSRAPARHRPRPLVAIFVEDLLFEPLGVGGKAVAKRAERRRRRGADAAHQRQRAPEGEPSLDAGPARRLRRRRGSSRAPPRGMRGAPGSSR